VHAQKEFIISYFKPWPRGLKITIIYQFIIKYNIDINGKIDSTTQRIKSNSNDEIITKDQVLDLLSRQKISGKTRG